MKNKLKCLLIYFIISVIKTLSINDSNYNMNINSEVKMYKTYEMVYKLAKSDIKRIIKSYNDMGKIVDLDFPYLKSSFSYRRKKLFSNRIVKDIVRCTIIFNSEDDLYSFSKQLHKKYWIVKVKNNFHDNKQRYKVYQITVFLKLFKNYFIEIQLQMNNSYYISKLTHDIYKILRNLYIIKDNLNNPIFTLKSQYYMDEILFHPYHILLSIKEKLNNQNLSQLDIFLEEIDYYMIELMKNINLKDSFSKIYNVYTDIKNKFDENKINIFADLIENYLKNIYLEAFNKKNI